MTEDRCKLCGGPLVQARTGRRALFCSARCRVKFHQGGPKGKRAAAAATAGRVSQAELVGTLEDLYERLRADVTGHGTLIPCGPGGDGLKANPSAALLVKVAGELGRMAGAPAPVEREATILELLEACSP